MPEVNAVTYNHDIHGPIRRLDRFIYELLHCVSGNQSLTNEFDQTRLISYIKAIRTYDDWVIAQPALDFPETGPRGMAVEAPLSIPKIENDDVMDILNLMDIARLELLNSQSSRLACNMMTYDSKRGQVVLFGGGSDNGRLADTWEYGPLDRICDGLDNDGNGEIDEGCRKPRS